MSDNNFVGGFFFKLPHENAPDFVKGKVSIKLPDLRQWLIENPQGDWLNVDLKVSKAGKGYAELDTWKPDKEKANENKVEIKEDEGSSLPF